MYGVRCNIIDVWNRYKNGMTTWTAYPEDTATFIDITNTPNSFTVELQHTSHFECFTVLMYRKNCGADSVNDARELIFNQDLKSLESISSSKHVFLLPHSFGRSRCPNCLICGWEWNDRTKEWVSYWTDLLDASHGFSLLFNCGYLVS